MGFKTFSKVIILFVICVVPLASSHDSKIYPAIFNFGDSNSDTGNYFAAMAPPPNPVYGQTYFKKPSGRASDGRLIIDFLMEAMGFPHLPPYLDSIGAPSFINGTDFAVGGAVIDDQNVLYGFPIHLKVQTNQFMRFKAKVEEMHAKCANFNPYIPPQDYFARALYMFDIGQNDLTKILYGNPLEVVLEKLPGIISIYELHVAKLYESGARNFWIHNTGPLGCLPEKIKITGNDSTRFDEFGCVISHNEAAKAFNLQLHTLFKKLQGRYSDANLVHVDIFTIKLNLITNYSKYGFEKNIMACCGYGGPPSNFDVRVGCGQTANLNGMIVTSKSCDDSSKYINWDGVHYTEAANQFVASEILRGKYSDPQYSTMMPNSNVNVRYG